MKPLHTRQTLFDKLAKNPERGWDEYVQYYKGYILALLKGMNMPIDDRNDLLQDILVKCWKKLPDFNYNPERGKFRSWLTIMTRNTVRNHIKSKAQRNKMLERDIDDFAISGDDTATEKMAEKEWRVYVAQLALEAVKKEFKETLVEAFIRASKGEKVAAIAADMGIAESSVSVYKTRVQNAIHKEVIRLETYLS